MKKGSLTNLPFRTASRRETIYKNCQKLSCVTFFQLIGFGDKKSFVLWLLKILNRSKDSNVQWCVEFQMHLTWTTKKLKLYLTVGQGFKILDDAQLTDALPMSHISMRAIKNHALNGSPLSD